MKRRIHLSLPSLSKNYNRKATSKIETNEMEEALTYGKFTRALTDRKLNDRQVRNIPRNSAPLVIPSEKKRKARSRKSQQTPLRWEIRINRNDVMPRPNLHSPSSIKCTIVSVRKMLFFYQNWLPFGSPYLLCSSCSPCLLHFPYRKPLRVSILLSLLPPNFCPLSSNSRQTKTTVIVDRLVISEASFSRLS